MKKTKEITADSPVQGEFPLLKEIEIIKSFQGYQEGMALNIPITDAEHLIKFGYAKSTTTGGETGQEHTDIA